MNRQTKRRIIEVLLRARQPRLAQAVARLIVARMSVPDALKVLDITGDQANDAAALKRAYRDASMRHHPDRGGSTEEMQRVNEAYEVLRQQSGRIVTPSDRAAREARQQEAAAIVKQMMLRAFDPKRFTDYLTKTVGKEFSFTIDWQKPDSFGYSMGFTAKWKSTDGATVFQLYTSSRLADFSWGPRKLGAGQDFSFPLSAYTEIFHETRKVKFKQSDWQLSDDSSVVFDPAKLFPAKKIRDMVGGKEKKRKFSKRDMLLGLEKRLDAHVFSRGKDIYANVPFGKDGMFKIQFSRTTVWGEGAWQASRLNEGTPGYSSSTKHELTTGFFGSEGEDLLIMLIDLQKKSANVTDPKVMVRMASQAIDRLVRQRKAA